MPKDYYIVLGVSRDAALVKIKRAYRKAVKRYHPDVTSSREGAEKFKKIKEAYETLRNEEKRRRYDKELARERSPFRITEVPSLVRRRTSLFDEIDTLFSRADDFFSGFLPGFFDRGKEKRIEKDVIGTSSGVSAATLRKACESVTTSLGGCLRLSSAAVSSRSLTTIHRAS